VFLRFIGLSLLFVSFGAFAADVPRQPTSKWAVDYAEAQCVASRDFGTAEKPLTLAFKPSPKGGVVRIIVLRSGKTATQEVAGTVQFGDTPEIKVTALNFTDDSGKYRLTAINLPMKTFNLNLDAPSLSIRVPGLRETFALTVLPQLAAQLATCLRDLQSHWNMGPAPAVKIAQKAKAVRPINQLFSSDDYPGVALMLAEQGSVSLTFLVDEQGKVADCSVEETSGISSLDTMSCYVLKTRAEFTPATDSEGKAIKSSFSQKIVWRVR
jgi:TonB family protein